MPWSDTDKRFWDEVYQYRLLIHIYETGSAAGAARRLNMTRSGARYAIQVSERMLGQRLFWVHSRNLRPTDYLKEILPRIYTIVNNHDYLRLRGLQRSPVGI